MRRIRVVQVITKLDFGGAERNVLYTLRNLNRHLFEPYLITGPGGSLDQEAHSLEGVSIQYCPDMSREVRPLADMDAIGRVRKIFQEWKPDIVHTHRPKAGIVGRLAAAAENVPVILHTYHGFGFHRYQPEGAFRLCVALDRETARRSHHLIFVCEANRKYAEQLDLFQQCGVSLLRTGVDLEPLLQAKRNPEFRKQMGVKSKGKLVGMISDLRPQKDPLTFVEAAALVFKKEPDTKFVLLGEGELLEAVLRRVQKLLPAETFFQISWMNRVEEVLANLDLLVVPSLWEGLPRIIPAATILGVPVIASNVDGIPEIVVEGKNGALAEPQNAKDFATKILQGLEEEWKVDSELSRRVQYQYDIRHRLRQEEMLYLELFTKRNQLR